MNVKTEYNSEFLPALPLLPFLLCIFGKQSSWAPEDTHATELLFRKLFMVTPLYLIYLIKLNWLTYLIVYCSL